MDFSQLSALELNAERTAEFCFTEIPGQPVLLVAPATEENPPYWAGLLKRSKKTLRHARAAGANNALVKHNRNDDRALFAAHVVRGWPKAPRDAKGVEVAFTPDACASFLKALPDWLFDRLRNFTKEPTNFLPDSEQDDDEVDELAGN